MEFLSILLASLIGGISPLGLILDQRIEARLRERITEVETLKVRVDNTPSYQLLQGKMQRLRLASRGIYLTPNLRLASFALETDPIALNLPQLQQGEFNSLSAVRQTLTAPLGVGIKASLNEQDFNRFFSSPEVKTRLEAIMGRVAEQLPSGRNQRYELLSSDWAFSEDNRFVLNLQIRVARRQREEWQDFNLRLESGIAVQQGKQLALVEPEFTVDGEPLPPRLVDAVSARISSRFDLEVLEEQKITARLLQLKIEEDEVKLAAFVQIASEASGELEGPNY